jgi:hypothetical protein
VIGETHNGELEAAKNEISKVVADLEGLQGELSDHYPRY